MRKIIIAGIAILLLATAGGAGYFILGALDPLIPLQNLGFSQARLDKSGTKIYLDPEKLSTATLEKPLKGISNPFESGELVIKKVILTGDINRNGTISFSGWNPPEEQEKFFAGFKSIEIKSVQLDLLHPDFGGITVNFDARIWRKDDILHFQANPGSVQRGLSFNGQLDGTMDLKTHLWHAQIFIGTGRFAEGFITANRVSGTIDASGSLYDAPRFAAALNIGSLILWGFPLQSTALTINGSANGLSYALGAKAQGAEDIEISFDYKNKTGTGTIYASNLENLADYLNKLVPESEQIRIHKPAENIWLRFNLEMTENGQGTLNYHIKDGIEKLNKKGEIDGALSPIFITRSYKPK